MLTPNTHWASPYKQFSHPALSAAAFHKGAYPYTLLGALVGFGAWRPLSLSVLVVLLLYLWRRRIPRRVGGTSFVQISLIAIFLCAYYVAYDPVVRIERDLGLSSFHYAIFVFYSLLAAFLVALARSRYEASAFLFSMTAGLLLHSLIVVIATIHTYAPPYHGLAFSPFTGSTGNSPAYSNMAMFFPVAALAFFPVFQRHRILVLFGSLLCAISIWIGVLLGGRTYFVTLFVALFVLFAFKSRNVKGIAIILAAVAIVLGFDIYMQSESSFYAQSREYLVERFTQQKLDSSRWELISIWLQQVMDDPFGHPFVPWNFRLDWFHNFWLDAYRDSGPLAFVMAVLVFVRPMWCLARSLFRDLGSSYQMAVLMLPVIAVCLTSVPMVAEQNALFFYFALSVYITRFAGQLTRNR